MLFEDHWSAISTRKGRHWYDCGLRGKQKKSASGRHFVWFCNIYDSPITLREVLTSRKWPGKLPGKLTGSKITGVSRNTRKVYRVFRETALSLRTSNMFKFANKAIPIKCFVFHRPTDPFFFFERWKKKSTFTSQRSKYLRQIPFKVRAIRAKIIL